jgi:hypothetical protein
VEDPIGNRLNEIVGGTVTAPMPSSSTASYTAASNQVSSVNGGAGLAYDAAGDVTQDPLNSYLYDAEEQKNCLAASHRGYFQLCNSQSIDISMVIVRC